MEGDPDVPENAKETDNLVPSEKEDDEGIDELTAEMTTLLSEMPGHSGVSSSSTRGDEADSQPSETTRPHPHPYHFKNKYTFRSDSVYSDVIPMSAASNHSNSHKTSESREKSGSLSSLKAKESKWTTLKKKLGRLNSSSSAVTSNSSSENPPEENKEGEKRRPTKSLNEKRSFFQRAKTMSILPVHRSSKERDDPPPPRRVIEPPELFNVGGEMNLIPLELLIDVNSVGLKR